MHLDKQIITPEMQEIKSMIITTVQTRDRVKKEMEAWYAQNPRKHFPQMQELILADSTLSKLDLHYKKLWDFHNINAS
jgi:hypothetical protein